MSEIPCKCWVFCFFFIAFYGIIRAVKKEQKTYGWQFKRFKNPCVQGPVSYTHLDVYKRQVLSFLKSICLSEIENICVYGSSTLLGNAITYIPGMYQYTFDFNRRTRCV